MNNFIILVILILINIVIYNFFKENIEMEEGFIMGSISTFIIWFIFIKGNIYNHNKINNYTNIINYIIILIVILFIGIGISKLFNNQLVMEEGYILGLILTILIIKIFGKKKLFFKNKFNSFNNILNIIILILAFIGGFLWAIGELLVYFGKQDHPLLDPIGAVSCALSALIALILFLE